MIVDAKYEEWDVDEILVQIIASRARITDEESFEKCLGEILSKKT